RLHIVPLPYNVPPTSELSTLSLHAALPILRVLTLVLQAHEVDDVHDAHLELGQVAAQQIRSREHLERGHVPRAREDDVGVLPAPDRKSTRLNSSHVRNSYAVFCA